LTYQAATTNSFIDNWIRRLLKMKLALIGATGFVGTRVLNEALERGHQVTAIVRNILRLPVHSNLIPRKADVQDFESISSAVAGHDVIISAYNPGHDLEANPQLYRDIVEGAVKIIMAAKRTGIRLVYIGGAGSLHVKPDLMLADDPDFPAEYSRHSPPSLAHFAEAKKIGKDVPLGGRTAFLLFEHDKSFAWSFLSPPLFMEPGHRTGKYRMGTDAFPLDGGIPAGIFVEDFAISVLDEIEDPRHLHGHFTVTR
jgi:hypothetical protein